MAALNRPEKLNAMPARSRRTSTATLRDIEAVMISGSSCSTAPASCF